MAERASRPPASPAERRRRARMLAWGALWAAIGALALYALAPSPWPIESSRANELRASLSVLERGGPLLLGYEPSTHAPYAIGYSDDQGVYAIVPALSRLLEASDPIAVLRWLWILAWAATLLSSAVVFGALFRSSWAALLAPPAMLVCIFSFGFGDIYWVAAWVVVALMPPLILLARRRPRHAWLALAAIALLAGIASAIRSEAGLGVALAAAAVAAVVGGRVLLRALVLAAVAVAYIAPSSFVLPAIRAHRDHSVGVDLSANEPTSHPLWHSLYIGLGYTTNRYGIHYADGYAAAAAQESDPGVAYLSPAYATAVHGQVDALVKRDPSFVVGAEAQKAVVELSHTARCLLLLALLLPAALAARGPARIGPWELALFLPGLAIGALPAVVAIPLRSYELGLLAPLGTIGLLAIGSFAARAQSEWQAAAAASGPADRARRARRGLGKALPMHSTALTLIVSAAALAPVFLFARRLEAEHERWNRSLRNPPTVVLAAAPASAAPAYE